MIDTPNTAAKVSRKLNQYTIEIMSNLLDNPFVPSMGIVTAASITQTLRRNQDPNYEENDLRIKKALQFYRDNTGHDSRIMYVIGKSLAIADLDRNEGDRAASVISSILARALIRDFSLRHKLKEEGWSDEIIMLAEENAKAVRAPLTVRYGEEMGQDDVRYNLVQFVSVQRMVAQLDDRTVFMIMSGWYRHLEKFVSRGNPALTKEELTAVSGLEGYALPFFRELAKTPYMKRACRQVMDNIAFLMDPVSFDAIKSTMSSGGEQVDEYENGMKSEIFLALCGSKELQDLNPDGWGVFFREKGIYERWEKIRRKIFKEEGVFKNVLTEEDRKKYLPTIHDGDGARIVLPDLYEKEEDGSYRLDSKGNKIIDGKANEKQIERVRQFLHATGKGIPKRYKNHLGGRGGGKYQAVHDGIIWGADPEKNKEGQEIEFQIMTESMYARGLQEEARPSIFKNIALRYQDFCDVLASCFADAHPQSFLSVFQKREEATQGLDIRFANLFRCLRDRLNGKAVEKEAFHTVITMDCNGCVREHPIGATLGIIASEVAPDRIEKCNKIVLNGEEYDLTRMTHKEIFDLYFTKAQNGDHFHFAVDVAAGSVPNAAVIRDAVISDIKKKRSDVGKELEDALYQKTIKEARNLGEEREGTQEEDIVFAQRKGALDYISSYYLKVLDSLPNKGEKRISFKVNKSRQRYTAPGVK